MADNLQPLEAEDGDRLGDPLEQVGRDRRRQLPEEVASYVRALILSGKVKTGQFLRLEPIAEALGVSNTPVREGLLALRAEGLVDLIPRRGFVVGSFTRQDVEDIFWAKATIGGELAARAAAKITKQELRRLYEIHQLYVKAVDDGDAADIARLGLDFHRVIDQASDSPWLATLMDKVVTYLPNRFYASLEQLESVVLHAHPAILESLQQRNARTARAHMRDHLLEGGEVLITELAARGIWNDVGEAAGLGG